MPRLGDRVQGHNHSIWQLHTVSIVSYGGISVMDTTVDYIKRNSWYKYYCSVILLMIVVDSVVRAWISIVSIVWSGDEMSCQHNVCNMSKIVIIKVQTNTVLHHDILNYNTLHHQIIDCTIQLYHLNTFRGIPA